MRAICCIATVGLVAFSAAAARAGDRIDPATLKDKVAIEPGKKLIVRFERDGDRLIKPKVVEEPGREPPTPTFDFRKIGDDPALVTTNPFPQAMKFRAAMRIKGRKDYVETSIVPVKGKLVGIELWRDAIEELVLFDFRLVGE